MPEPGVPESFKVLIKELQSLGLDIKVLSEDKEEIKISEVYEDEDDTRPLSSRLDSEGESGRDDNFGMFDEDEDEDEDDDFDDDFEDDFGDDFGDEDDEEDEEDDDMDDDEDIEPTDEDLLRQEDEDL